MHQIVYPVAGPDISSKEIDYVTDAITNGWYDRANEYINKFEKEFAHYLGRQYAISLPSCTSGLHLSLMSLGIGPGDEVIVPDATWIASSAPITYVGATPIFADIDPNTWCLSKSTVEKLITTKTKAIIAVNLYGHMPDYESLQSLGIPIIEDAAESIGSRYNNKLSGTFGVTSCFSFHGSKTMVTGEGGMLVTDDQALFNKCMILRDHGRLPGDTLFNNFQVGYKYKMTNLQAALGLAQLERIDELVLKKREIFINYKSLLEGYNFITLNPDDKKVYNSYWMSTALFNKELNIKKSEIIKDLEAQGIATRPFFEPLSSLIAYKDAKDSLRASRENKNAYSISSRAINLPSAACLKLEDCKVIVNTLAQMIQEYATSKMYC